MRQLGFPTLFCNQLEIDQDGRIVKYHMRMQNQKKHSVAAFKSLNFHVLGRRRCLQRHRHVGRSPRGVLFLSSDHLPKEFPQFPVTKTYGELQARFARAGNFR